MVAELENAEKIPLVAMESTQNTCIKQTDSEDQATETEPAQQKSYRKRKRQFYNSIRAQMEFYFGDANLSKDRFLKQLIDKDPFVPLDVFLTFNKLKALTSSVQEIAKSLSNSELLELDETQQKVRRKTAAIVERNVDEKTLYVEALPPSADHDWVRKIFERFGAVGYVSLPKYTKSRKIKEFGFVEFEQEAALEKALKAFREFNGVLSMQETDPSELKSIKSFIKEQKDEQKLLTAQKDKTTKRKRNTSESPEEPKAKKSKKLVDDACAATDEDGDSTTASGDTTEGETTNDDNNMQTSDELTKKKKRRKRKKKSKTAAKQRKEDDLDTDASYYELKILPKRDWKRLRNKYLNLQREKIAELKRKAWKEKQQAQQQAKENATETVDTVAPSPSKKTKPHERKLQRMNMNFYGAGEEEPMQKAISKDLKRNPALERAPLFSYEPGLIVEVKFMEPCVNIKEFKSDMRQYATVRYVDIKEGALLAHLRLDNVAAAAEFVRQINCAEYNCKILSGETETEYWKKIEKDREMKMNKQVKVPQKRGRERVKKLIAKQQHIRFGDDDADE